MPMVTSISGEQGQWLNADCCLQRRRAGLNREQRVCRSSQGEDRGLGREQQRDGDKQASQEEGRTGCHGGRRESLASMWALLNGP